MADFVFNSKNFRLEFSLLLSSFKYPTLGFILLRCHSSGNLSSTAGETWTSTQWPCVFLPPDSEASIVLF